MCNMLRSDSLILNMTTQGFPDSRCKHDKYTALYCNFVHFCQQRMQVTKFINLITVLRDKVCTVAFIINFLSIGNLHND